MTSITLAAVTLAIVLLSRKDCCIHESQVFSIQGVKKKNEFDHVPQTVRI